MPEANMPTPEEKALREKVLNMLEQIKTASAFESSRLAVEVREQVSPLMALKRARQLSLRP